MNFGFNPLKYSYHSRRGLMYGTKGMVCTSQPLAAQAGLDMLKKGGNAVDAAIATAIALTVLEPTSNGLGSDAFAQVWVGGKLYGLNGSGYAPALLSPDCEALKGKTAVPERGWESVDVPGAVSAWAELHKRFGKLPFADLFAPAIDYAENGYPVSPVISRLWHEGLAIFEPYKNNEAFKGWFDTFTKNGETPAAGTVAKLPDQAKTLRLIAGSCGETFYRGEVADVIDAFSKSTGGYIRKSDLAAYRAEWVEPISIDYRGYRVWELPPNGHGIVALMALNILQGFEHDAKGSAENLHHEIEAMKLAYADGRKYVADPRYMKAQVKELLSDEYTAQRRALIGEEAIMPQPGNPFCGGTVYLCTADAEGNMVSYIQSNFQGFGSGIVVPGYGIAFNDRANGFVLDPQHDDYLAPLKKPYHTIIPGFLTKDGKAVGPFGVMGGYMQPQGHLQVIHNLIDFGMNPQEALDSPRWQWIEGKKVMVEAAMGEELINALRARGHELIVTDDTIDFGRGQMILRSDDGVLVGATEPRADGTVAVW